MSARKSLYEFVLEPGTGKALELLKGQILRIEQIEGGQCADLNCFNLHDYKEFLHTGRTRAIHGMQLTKGHFLWSAPPRERPIVYILEDTVGSNDTLFPRCTNVLYESLFGLEVHTNCQDILAEAEREYGLTPDDVHDSFNMFMHTAIGDDGEPRILPQKAKKGDYIELMAVIDVLAVPNVCGADVTPTSDFSLKPLKIVVFEASNADRAALPTISEFKSQRTVEDFKSKAIKADRPLRRDPSYRAEYTNVPLEMVALPIPLNSEERSLLRRLKDTSLHGSIDADVMRFIIFSWWHEVLAHNSSRNPFRCTPQDRDLGLTIPS